MIGYSRAFNELYGPKPVEGKFKMNERIKELWNKAAESTAAYPSGQNNSWETQVNFMEKFAELIIRECGKVAFDDWCEGTNEYSSQIAILKHFNVGVEE